VVRVARNREGKKFAVKAYQRSALSSEDRRGNLESEIQILQKVQHPCIPAYQETI
jgi:serine/threonine protein kinase